LAGLVEVTGELKLELATIYDQDHFSLVARDVADNGVAGKRYYFNSFPHFSGGNKISLLDQGKGWIPDLSGNHDVS
jgi:hypothetical protein